MEKCTKKDELILLYFEEEAAAFLSFSLIDTDLISLDKLATLPEFRHKGLALNLLDKLFLFAKEKSIKRIILETARSNAAALTFYKKTGFQEIHSRKNYYKNKIDAVIMEKIL